MVRFNLQLNSTSARAAVAVVVVALLSFASIKAHNHFANSMRWSFPRTVPNDFYVIADYDNGKETHDTIKRNAMMGSALSLLVVYRDIDKNPVEPTELKSVVDSFIEHAALDDVIFIADLMSWNFLPAANNENGLLSLSECTAKAGYGNPFVLGLRVHQQLFFGQNFPCKKTDNA